MTFIFTHSLSLFPSFTLTLTLTQPRFHYFQNSLEFLALPLFSGSWDDFKRVAKPLDSESKFRMNQCCSCCRWKQGSDFAAAALQLEGGLPRESVCKYGNLMVPGAANKNAAVTEEGSQQPPKARIHASSKCVLCFPQVAR